ncbi:MAG: homoserine kinase [Gemmatimonadota bacterium]
MSYSTPFPAVTVFAPGSIGNLACGFDALGMALHGPGDEVEARLAPEPGLRIVEITGATSPLPADPSRNSAGAAARAVLERSGGWRPTEGPGVELRLRKGLPLSGGMGGSASSAAAAAFAVDQVMETHLPPEDLLEATLEGEWATSRSRHGDNAAASLFGGIVLVRSSGRRSLVRLPSPVELCVALLHPPLEMPTRDSRTVIPPALTLPDAVVQWQNTAALVAALYERDWELLGEAMEDRVSEPARGLLIRGFPEVKEAAIRKGALGCSVSGGGPSMFALAVGLERAREVGAAMAETYRGVTGAQATLYLSQGAAPGARVIAGTGGDA